MSRTSARHFYWRSRRERAGSHPERPAPRDPKVRNALSLRPIAMTALFLCVLCVLTTAPSVLSLPLPAQTTSYAPEWCKALPRPEYKQLERVSVSDPWFEVYKVVPGVFAIYEPHQAEETISYLIVGDKHALLFDTGMGISDIKKTAQELTNLPIVVLNSHTHNDHVGDNWEFETVYGMDTEFTRTNAKGSFAPAQEELSPGSICGNLPKDFNAKAYATKPWKITRHVQSGDEIDLGNRKLEVIATPGHTPDSICLLDSANGLLFTGDTYYPAPIWLFRPETNLNAYVASVKRLATLAPKLKLVLGAHNVPFAEPSVLPRLVTAIQNVRAGQGTVTPAGPGKAMHKIDAFSFLMRAE